MRRRPKSQDTSPPAKQGDDPRWLSVMARDRASDGRFLFAVRTTGVYCKPSCASRRARRENVEFFPGPREAEAAGYRPCKRCRPAGAEPAHAPILAACALVRETEEPPGLIEMAAAAGLSPHHFHRRFKAATGVTPKAFVAAESARRLRAGLDTATTVTAAIHAAGYGSSSRFYEAANSRLGMPATTWRRGGEGVAISYAVGECWLGAVIVAGTAKGICAIELGDDAAELRAALARRFPKAILSPAGPDFATLVADVIAAIDGPGDAPSLPLDVQGTAFQEQVWRALRTIQLGDTQTYAELAQRLDRPQAVRAVATACASNPLAVLVPCHRIVRSDGGLGGYRWGLARKERLIDREKSSRRNKP